MAKTKADPGAADTGPVKCRVLCDCLIGKINDIVTLDAADVVAHKDIGNVDDDPASVAYAESLVAPVAEAVLE